LAAEQDIDVEILFQDQLLIAAHMRNAWARRRKIDPAELIDTPWILTAPGTSVYLSVAEAFRDRGLAMPKISVVAQSGQVRMSLLATGPFITAVPRSLLLFNAARFSLKVLPVDLEIQGYPVAILTLKNRLLSPLIGLFLDRVRSIAGSIVRTGQSG
jgi:DNA-binding transcriptional LysR family regulator